MDILQALRSHAERMVEQLASCALTRGDKRRLHVPHTRPATGTGEGTEAEEEAQQEVGRISSGVVNFARPRDATDVDYEVLQARGARGKRTAHCGLPQRVALRHGN